MNTFTLSDLTTHHLIVESHERLDRYLTQALEGLSRSRIQKLIEQGMVQLNDCICDNKKTLVKQGDRLSLTIPETQPLDLEPEDIPLDILYEDEYLLVINKPAGIVMHPAPGHASGTLVNALLAHCTRLSGINGIQRPGIVHRLDKDTSGATIVAKTDLAHQNLQIQFNSSLGQAKIAKREYLGLVAGAPKTNSGTVSAPIGRHPVERKKMAVVEKGRSAITHWTMQERLGNFTLLKFELETGRTHQIRVHAAHMGYAIAGDRIYGRPLKQIPHQVLHAWRLTFKHPISGAEMTAIAPLPLAFEKLLNELRRKSTN